MNILLSDNFETKLGTIETWIENNLGENIYFHFLVATNSINPSLEDSKYSDVLTWLAVDRSKRYLGEYLKFSE